MSDKAQTPDNIQTPQTPDNTNLETGLVKQGGSKIAITKSVQDLDTHLKRLHTTLGAKDAKAPNVLGDINGQLSQLGAKINPDGTLDIGQGTKINEMNEILSKIETADGKKFLDEHKKVDMKQADGSTKTFYEGGTNQGGDVRHFLAEVLNGIMRIMRGDDIFGNNDAETQEFNGRVAEGLSSKDKSVMPDQYKSVLGKLGNVRYKDIFEKRLANADFNNIENNQYVDQVMKDVGIDPKNKKAFCKILKDLKQNEAKISSEISVSGETTVGDALRALYGKDYGSKSGGKSRGDSAEAKNYKSDGSAAKYGTKEIIQKLGGSKEAVERQLTSVNFFGANLKVNKNMAPALQNAQSEIKAYQSQHPGSEYKVNPSKCGGYVWRGKANGGGGYHDVASNPSNHATGLAIDINRDDNPYMRNFKGGNRFQYCTLPPYFVEIMKKNGFIWGGDRNSPYDAMHFEYTKKDSLKL